MLTTEMKHKVFLELRDENYRDSLRLEGLEPQGVVVDKSDVNQAEPVRKDVR